MYADKVTGQPVCAFIYSDAMTLLTGNTPKEGVKRSSKIGKVITNRLFGVQIICGPIKFMMYISVDNMISGGANLAIEIQRKSIEKLSDELQKRNLLMPSTMYWQFDNCGENKVSNNSITLGSCRHNDQIRLN